MARREGLVHAMAIVAMFVVVVVAIAAMPGRAQAEELTRSEEARLASVQLDVGLAVQGWGANATSGAGGAFEPYFRLGFGLADPERRVHSGFVVRDEAWFEVGGLGLKNVGGTAVFGAGVSILPGFRADIFGLFLGPSARAGAWMAASKERSHVFTSTSLPLEARLELYDRPSDRLPLVALTAWWSPVVAEHLSYGGRVDVLFDAKAGTSFFLSFDRSQGIHTSRDHESDLATHGDEWDVRLGVHAVVP